MSDSGVRCGNCGTPNEPGAQFCVSCGVLLAAYQPPAGARSTTIPDEPSAPSTSESAAPPSTEPAAPELSQPSAAGVDDVEEDDATASSVDDVFGSLPDVTMATTKRAPTGDVPAVEETVRSTPAARPLHPASPLVPPAEPDIAATAEATATQPTTAETSGSATTSLSVPRQEASPPAAPPRYPTFKDVIESGDARGSFGQAGQRISTTPPQTLIVVGVGLTLASCVLGPTASAFDLPFIIQGPMWCAFPAGVIVLVIGLIQLASRRQNRL